MAPSDKKQNATDQVLRDQLIQAVGGRQAHIDFESAIAGIQPNLRRVRPPNAPHSPWELLEHMRITQHDILQFSIDPNYESPKWPEGYWPKKPEPPDNSAWDRTVKALLADRKAFEDLLQNPKSDLFTPFPYGDGQTLLREALLIASHNSYHLGQLVYAHRQLQNK
jgi:hypothetical protein